MILQNTPKRLLLRSTKPCLQNQNDRRVYEILLPRLRNEQEFRLQLWILKLTTCVWIWSFTSVKIAFLDTLLKRNNGEISVLVYTKPTHTDQYLHYSSHQQTSCNESVVSSLFNRAYSIITNKDDLHKENARIKQVLKENGYQESIISKIFKRITSNHSLPQPPQLTQATDIQEEEKSSFVNLKIE